MKKNKTTYIIKIREENGILKVTERQKMLNAKSKGNGQKTVLNMVDIKPVILFEYQWSKASINFLKSCEYYKTIFNHMLPIKIKL